MGYNLHTVACGVSDLNLSDLKNLVINPERSQSGFSKFGVYLLDSWEVAPVAAIIFVYLSFAGLTIPSRDWWPIQCVPYLSPFSSWETFYPPRFLDGWMDWWMGERFGSQKDLDVLWFQMPFYSIERKNDAQSALKSDVRENCFSWYLWKESCIWHHRIDIGFHAWLHCVASIDR